ncbi:unnamed protein product [Ambrosiozyma monospora]|uniref:Unnamed protein product n=1 Tax=Ambrosiozyma monospora TaxID=43982 RepID=A0ACB5TDA4_AMBMO|nr:unnamed protein product [Ambrosiozyma monospora]
MLIKYKLEVSADGGRNYIDTTNPNAPTGLDADIFFTVEETFDNNHMVGSQLGSHADFLFTAFDGGEHRVCLRPQVGPGYKLNQKARLTLDVSTGDKSILDKGEAKGEEIQQRVQRLTKTLRYLKNEYQVFRHKEAIFRDLSEDVNSGAVKWVIFQFVVLIGICYFQLDTLKTFFVKQKVV